MRSRSTNGPSSRPVRTRRLGPDVRRPRSRRGLAAFGRDSVANDVLLVVAQPRSNKAKGASRRLAACRSSVVPWAFAASRAGVGSGGTAGCPWDRAGRRNPNLVHDPCDTPDAFDRGRRPPPRPSRPVSDDRVPPEERLAVDQLSCRATAQVANLIGGDVESSRSRAKRPAARSRVLRAPHGGGRRRDGRRSAGIVPRGRLDWSSGRGGESAQGAIVGAAGHQDWAVTADRQRVCVCCRETVTRPRSGRDKTGGSLVQRT